MFRLKLGLQTFHICELVLWGIKEWNRTICVNFVTYILYHNSDENGCIPNHVISDHLEKFAIVGKNTMQLSLVWDLLNWSMWQECHTFVPGYHRKEVTWL